MLYSILNSGGNIDFVDIVMHILATLTVMIVVLPFHELAHGFVANKLGDDTAKRAGRLTFNPIQHLDPIGAACLLLVGFGWAKPVPVNMYKLKNPKRDMALVALAGPVANLIAAFVGCILNVCWVHLFQNNFGTKIWFLAILYFLYYYVVVNVSLAVFNLIPLPPLDGSKILGAFLPEDLYQKQLMNEDKLSWILVILVMTNVLDKIMDPPIDFFLTALYTLAELPFKLFG